MNISLPFESYLPSSWRLSLFRCTARGIVRNDSLSLWQLDLQEARPNSSVAAAAPTTDPSSRCHLNCLVGASLSLAHRTAAAARLIANCLVVCPLFRLHNFTERCLCADFMSRHPGVLLVDYACHGSASLSLPPNWGPGNQGNVRFGITCR